MPAWIDELLSSLPWPAVCAVVTVCAYLEGALFVGLVVPGETALLFGGAAAARGDGPLPAFILATAMAAVGGDLTSFVVGRRHGDRIRRSRLGRRLGEERWGRADALLERQGGTAVLAARFVPVAQAVLPVLAGSGTMPMRRFLPWNAAGALVWSTAYVTAGYVGGTSYERYGSAVTGAVLGVVAASAAAVWTRRRLRRRNAVRLAHSQ